jgi:hypothetical protein
MAISPLSASFIIMATTYGAICLVACSFVITMSIAVWALRRERVLLVWVLCGLGAIQVAWLWIGLITGIARWGLGGGQ